MNVVLLTLRNDENFLMNNFTITSNPLSTNSFDKLIKYIIVWPLSHLLYNLNWRIVTNCNSKFEPLNKRRSISFDWFENVNSTDEKCLSSIRVTIENRNVIIKMNLLSWSSRQLSSSVTGPLSFAFGPESFIRQNDVDKVLIAFTEWRALERRKGTFTCRV